jgi:tRNA-splicing ligase RtcB (3'-phosphate/5'-hydroxy nucleic acid ligase)
MTTIIEEGDKIGKIFLEKNEIEVETFKQIKSMIKNETIENARIMPDCHKSKNCCVGFTSKLIDKIVPNFVGGDIGCGIVSYPLNIEKKMKDWREKKLKNLSEDIYYEFNYLNKITVDKSKYISRILELSNQEVKQFVIYYKDKFQVDLSEKIPEYNHEWLDLLLQKVKSNLPELEKSLGTLGGGNHFIEFNRSEKTQLEYLTIHSGSRIMGKKICEYHQNKIIKQNEVDWEHFDREVLKFNKTNKNKKERITFRDKLRSEMEIKDKKKYLDEDDAIDYYFDMIFGQKFAMINREFMMEKILDKFNLKLEYEQKIESIHNYIDFTDFIIRKGAINAHEGKLCLIALNMVDGILLCSGKGNEEWNYSSAHGSGRIMTRKVAINKIQPMTKRLEKIMKEKEIITYPTIGTVIDESPECYKDTDFICEKIQDSIVILEQLKPFLNIKNISEGR